MGLQADLLPINGAGFITKLPKATDVQVMEELNGDGQLSFNLAANAVGTSQLLACTEGLLRISLDGEPVAWGVLDKDGDDSTAGAGRPVTVAAPGPVVLLADAIVLGDTATAQQRSFTTATPGFIMRALLLEAQGRGALQGVTWTFSDTHDSAGVPWPTPWTGTYEAGGTVREVLGNLVDLRLVDFRMVGLELRLYVADTYLRRDLPGVTLVKQWLTEAPRERARQGKVTHLTVLGDGGRMVQVSAADLVAAGKPADPSGRRREAFAQIGGIGDDGTLILAGQATLQPMAKQQQGYTCTYLLGPDTTTRPRPWTDYRVGDRIRRGDVRLPDGSLEPLRIASVSVSLSDQGATAVSLELNDLFYEAEVINKLRLDKLTNGAVITIPQGLGVDDMKPAPPASVEVTSDTYPVGNGELQAQATVSWPVVTTNADGTPTTDVVGYEVQWNQNGWGFGSQIDRTTAQTISRSPLPLGGTLQVRVRAVDATGNYSDWRVSSIITLAVDTVPPPKPSAPVVTSQLGLITVGWDGKADGGGAMPADLASVEVWQSTVAGKSPGDAGTSLVEQLRPQGGECAIRGTAYGQNIYVTLRARDRSYNYSPKSAEGVGQRQYVVSPDIFDGAVGSQKLADLAVIRAKIADLAVNNAKIADLAVGNGKIIDLQVDKLTGGVLNAGVVIGGNIVAGDPFGARVALYPTGLYAYDSLGRETARIKPGDNAMEVGAAGGPRARLSAVANVFQSGQSWGLLEFFSGNGLWDPGKVWANYDAGGTIGELRMTSPFLSSLGFGGAATLTLAANSGGGKSMRVDAGSFYFGSGGTSVDLWAQYTNQWQFLNPGGLALNINFGDPGTGYGATGIAAKTEAGQPRQMVLRSSWLVVDVGPGTRQLNVAANYDSPASPLLWDNGADVGISMRNTDGGRLDVVGVFGNNYKWIKCWSVNSVSDVSWKADIRDVPTSKALEQIMGLRAREYSVKDHDPKQRTRGLVAQEVRDALPLAAIGEDGDMGVDHYVLITTLVAAVQELAARVPAKAGAGK